MSININGKAESRSTWANSWMFWILSHSATPGSDEFNALLEKFESNSLSIKIVIDNKLELTDFHSAISELERQFESHVRTEAKKIIAEKYQQKLDNLVANFLEELNRLLPED